MFTPSRICNVLYSRLLKETGRYSISPVFVVGIYSGADKLGEGFGSSLKMAEFRVCILIVLALPPTLSIFIFPGCRRLPSSIVLDKATPSLSPAAIINVLWRRG